MRTWPAYPSHVFGQRRTASSAVGGAFVAVAKEVAAALIAKHRIAVIAGMEGRADLVTEGLKASKWILQHNARYR